MEKPDVDEISGIAPAVAIRQKNTTRNPRSTVATATEIYDYLRLFFARCGQTFCLKCGAEVRKDTPDAIAEKVLSLGHGRRFYVLYQLKIAAPQPAAKPRKAERKKITEPAPEQLRIALLDLQKRGFNRLYQEGRVHEFISPESLLDVDFKKPVHVLVDRLAVSEEAKSRLIDSVEICYREGQGETIVQFVPDTTEQSRANDVAAERIKFNERFECKNDGTIYQEPEPRLFSFNNPYGACPRCQGFGNTVDFDLNLVVPDLSKSLDDGAIEPWTKPRYRVLLNDAKKWAKAQGIPTNVPWRQLKEEERQRILEEIRSRLQFLDEVGLDYLSLDRLTSTLSGGESQRIQLATSLGSHLVGALYVLDEPSIGLHPRDTKRLIDILKSLRDLGNTVLVVEHDPDTIEAADRVIDLAPGAGELGGKLLSAGRYDEILKDPESITGRYLSGVMRIPVPNTRHKPAGKFLRIHGVPRPNLKK